MLWIRPTDGTVCCCLVHCLKKYRRKNDHTTRQRPPRRQRRAFFPATGGGFSAARPNPRHGNSCRLDSLKKRYRSPFLVRSHPRLIRITHAQLWCGSCNADRGARNDERVLLTSKRPATDRRCSVAAVRIVKRNNSSRHKKGRFLFVLPSLPGFQPPVFFGARYVRAKGLARALLLVAEQARPPSEKELAVARGAASAGEERREAREEANSRQKNANARHQTLGLLARRALLLVFFLVRGVPFEPPNPRRHNVLSPKCAPPPRSGTTVKERHTIARHAL